MRDKHKKNGLLGERKGGGVGVQAYVLKTQRAIVGKGSIGLCTLGSVEKIVDHGGQERSVFATKSFLCEL